MDSLSNFTLENKVLSKKSIGNTSKNTKVLYHNFTKHNLVRCMITLHDYQAANCVFTVRVSPLRSL